MDTMNTLSSNGYHKKVDALMDRLYGAGVTSHQTIIEQINYLFFLRELSRRDKELLEIGVKNEDDIIFDGELTPFNWENLTRLNPDALFEALEKCFALIPQSTKDQVVRLLFRNAHVKVYDKPTLRILVHEIDEFARDLEEKEKSGRYDIFGDMYEYLLSKLAQAGTNGQFRTPRHIIKFMVEVLDPNKGETILDPACGTAGFLVAAYSYLAHKYTGEEYLKQGRFNFDKLSSQEYKFLYDHTFTGFDSDDEMIKFGLMNLYLHGVKHANLVRQNTLTDTAGNRDRWSIVLANPPFAGKLDRESVSEDLQMATGSTEVLFLRYIIDHLTPEGRCAVIVPEGVLFGSTAAHKKIQQMLLDNGLWSVVSLPAGVFNPYAGVKTSILFLDKSKSSQPEVLFYEVQHDGYDVTANRKPIKQNDLTEALQVLKGLQTSSERLWKVSRSEITDRGLALSANIYRPASSNENSFRDPKDILTEINVLKSEAEDLEKEIEALI